MKTLFYLKIPRNKIYQFFNIKQLGHKVLTIRIVSDSSVSLDQSKVQRDNIFKLDKSLQKWRDT